MCSADEQSFLQIVRPFGIIEGVFVGHDHMNSYSGWYEGVYLAYGAKTGCSGYASGNRQIGKVITLTLNGDDRVEFTDKFVDENG